MHVGSRGLSREMMRWGKSGPGRVGGLIWRSPPSLCVLTLPAILAPVKLHDSFWIDWVWTDQFAASFAQGMLYPRWSGLA